MTVMLLIVVLGCLPGRVRGQESTSTLTERVKAQAEMLKLVEEAAGLESQGQVDAAIPLIEQALSLSEKSQGLEDANTGMVLVNLARLYEKKQEVERSIGLYERASSILEKTKGPEDRTVALPLGSLAGLYAKKGDYERAEAMYRRTLSIQEKASGPEDASVSLTLNFLASLLIRKGDFAQAEPLLLRALAIREKVSGPEDILVAVMLNNLATLYDTQADYARAEPAYLRSLAIYEKNAGVELQITRTLNNLAALYRSTGDYAQAETLAQRALSLGEKALGPEHTDVATSLNSLGQLNFIKGDLERAAQFFRRALAIYEKALGPEHREVASALNNLAIYHQERKEFAAAEKLLQRTLAIYEKTQGTEHLEVATALDNLAVLYHEMGDGARAETFVKRALQIRERQLGDNHPSVAMALNNLAAITEAGGDYVRAEPLYRRALEIEEKALGANHPTVAGFLTNLATMLWSKGDIGQAVNSLTRVAEIREHNLDYILATGSQEQKRLYLATLAGETDIAIWLHINSAPKDQQALQLAFNTILQRKGRALDAMSDQVASLRRRLNPEDRELLDQLSRARSALATLSLKGPGETADTTQYRSEISRLEAEVQRLEAAVSSRSAEFRVQSQPVTLERVQQAIPSGAALVEIVSYRPFESKAQPGKRFGPTRYAAYVLLKEGAARWVDLGEAAPIDAEIAKLRAALRDSSNTKVKQAGRALDERVMRPVRQLLGETRMVFLSPDSELNLIPFGALVDEQNRFLVERYSFTYLTSGRDLLRLQSPPQSRQAPLVMADPLFGKAVSRTPAAVAKTSKASANRRSAELASVNFIALPGTAEEAQALGRILPNARVLTGARATEAALKAVDGPTILHVATHGFFLDKPKPEQKVQRGVGRGGGFNEALSETLRGENPLLRSGLALAGANAGGGDDEDGILTALEASALDLWGTKLVVLSACETGIGEARKGDGVYGLRRALVLAGAESQVMSLWQVSDDATRDLMTQFYTALQTGQGRSEALRQVQLKMLKDPELSHPYYWASFIPAGDWRSLNQR
jgi:CHAT domain-containing protein/Tfp pilus assembly protein PilF